MKSCFFRGKFVMLALLAGLAMPSTPVLAGKKTGGKTAVQSKKTKQASQGKARKKAQRPRTLSDQFAALKQSYRRGEINRRQMWEGLSRLNDAGQGLSKEDRVSLLQNQATMLTEAGYPIIAAIYAAQAVKISDDPTAGAVSPSWDILRKVSEQRPIQNVLEIVAESVDLNGKDAPAFGADWNYFAGNASAKDGKTEKALAHYNQLKIDGRYFFPGKYQQAMLLVDDDKLDDAEISLKAILYPTSQRLSPLGETTRTSMMDYAYLALGRIYYEKENFLDAAKMYRNVSRNSVSFYDALFEQSWAFFMGGYPMHALGSLYAAESPFYAEVFNPEAPLLRSMVHYWLCRYEESRNALADFLENYAEAVDKLEDFLERKRLDPEVSYQLFENLISGVSGESMGVPRSILQTASERDSMLFVRNQYAALVEEKNRLDAKGIFGSRNFVAKPASYLDRWSAALRTDIGKRFLAELQDMRKDFDRMHSQAQFLYVELLMSEKDQILGKELHASTKISKVGKKMKLAGWAEKTQAWKDSRIGEYWWDEMGYYIVPVDAECRINAQ